MIVLSKRTIAYFNLFNLYYIVRFILFCIYSAINHVIEYLYKNLSFESFKSIRI
ncbi:hypothetical protein C1646_692407 [Rhizophagus diaphanus]|nr:hypothetical protein C1646_692407 [Rhizophagus diaphanus] [Rhizophagus sp. MUCL 43196]